MTTRPVNEIVAELRSTDPDVLGTLIEGLANDRRAGVRHAVDQAVRRRDAYSREMARLAALARLECELIDSGLVLVAGVDEVGRGALAGPVTACACVFDRDTHIIGIDDSKRLTPQVRERLAIEITERARDVSVAHVDPADIDRIGIAGATVLAMRRALGGLVCSPDHVLVDGLPVDLGLPCTAIVSGDASIRAIGAASIVAKVSRDRLMVELESQYPGYGFAGSKGYGSPGHIEAIKTLGPTPVHRMSFAPCSDLSLF